MKRTGICNGANDLDYLINLTEKYYGSVNRGIFLDIGANIGTASIYAKHILPDIKVMGFEPGKLNYDICRVNCIINNMNDILIENLGLGDRQESYYYDYVPCNPGGSHISEETTGEMVTVTTLDDYIQDNRIDSNEIAFIWMDVEGFESKVIIGAQKLLTNNRIPLFHEFNPELYIKNGTLDEYCNILNKTYDYFVDIRKNKNKNSELISINMLKEYSLSFKGQSDLFFI